MTRREIAFGLLAGVLAPAVRAGLAQQIGTPGPPGKPKGYVSFTAEPQTVPAGKRSVLELHFRVVEGFHVNSHTPSSELLIPTELILQAAKGVKASEPEYPAGTAYSFSFEPNEKLDVYSGAFTLKMPVTATAGDHIIEGSLKYQACDHAACYPPKSLPLQILFTAR